MGDCKARVLFLKSFEPLPLERDLDRRLVFGVGSSNGRGVCGGDVIAPSSSVFPSSALASLPSFSASYSGFSSSCLSITAPTSDIGGLSSSSLLSSTFST